MNFHMSYAEGGLIVFGGNKCWSCGIRHLKMTQHHSIPQRTQPVQNVIVPLCKPCHEKVNTLDRGAMSGLVDACNRGMWTIQDLLGKVLNINKNTKGVDDANKTKEKESNEAEKEVNV